MTDQLDLLGGMGGAAREGEVRWATAEGTGRLGWASTSLRPDAAKAAKAAVVLLLGSDTKAAAEAFGAAELDVRALASEEHADAARHRAALAADLHGGRSALVLAGELGAAAFVVARALMESGLSAAAAIAACGGADALGEPRVERLRQSERAPDAAPPEPEAKAAPEPEAKAAPEPEAKAAPEQTKTAPEAETALEAKTAPEQTKTALEAKPAPPAKPAAAAEAKGKSDAERADDRAEAELEFGFEDRELELADAAVFDEAPLEVRATSGRGAASSGEGSGLGPQRSRLVGVVLGGAIGDAMGHPTEFISSFESIRARFGPEGVTGYELWREEGGVRFAPYTDDTQMAECVLRALLAGRDGDWGLERTMRDMAQRFVKWSKEPQGGHRAPGNACLAGCRALERGVHWSEAGGEKAGGCGSVMRAYPFGLVFAGDLQRAERWAVAHSKLTHRDPIALAASAAMAVGVARAVRGESAKMVLSEMIGAACRYSPRTAEMMARALDEAERGVEPEVTLTRLEGWAAHEAIAAAVYLFARHADDARAAILEGANTPGDSDSLATLVGALCGARLGLEGLPAEWVRDVERGDALTQLALRIAQS